MSHDSFLAGNSVLIHQSVSRIAAADRTGKSSIRRSLVIALVEAAAIATWAVAVSAAPIISQIPFTGTNIPIGQGGQDSSWQVVAWPVSAPNQPTLPYPAWVFSGNPGGGQNIPNVWLGGMFNAGFGGARWIGLQENNTRSVLPDAPPPGFYTAIYSTTFTSTEAGNAFVWLRATADNRVAFFVNGSVTDTNTDAPSIVGGTQVGTTVQGFGSLKTVAGTVPVLAGTNTLYAVVVDTNTTGTFGSTGLIVVPEPSTIASAGLGVGLVAFGLARRRKR